MNYHVSTLDNGLRLVTAPMDELKSATVIVGVGAGSRCETANIKGLFHFIEHMAFKGTKNRPTTMDIASEVESVGGVFNAFTDKEITAYHIKLSNKHIKLAFDILSDMLTNSLYKQEEIGREKGVIIEEINMYEDTPMAKVWEVFTELLYGDNAMGWSTAGDKKTVAGIQRHDFIENIKKFYYPQNLVVAVAGGVEEKETKKLANDFFGKLRSLRHPSSGSLYSSNEERSSQITSNNKTTDLLQKRNQKITEDISVSQGNTFQVACLPARQAEWTPGSVGELANAKNIHHSRSHGLSSSACHLEGGNDGWVSTQSTPRTNAVYKKTDQAHFCLGVPGYEITHKDRYALSVLSDILGGGMSSRLFMQIRERRGLAYYVRCGDENFTDSGFLAANAGVKVEKVKEAIKVALDEFEKIRKTKVGDKELKKVKEMMKGQMILALEDSGKVAVRYLSQMLFENKLRSVDETLKEIDKVTADDVQRVAKDILKPEKMNLALIGPYKDFPGVEKA